MSTAFFVWADIAFSRGGLAKWRRQKIDDPGSLPEAIGALAPNGIRSVAALEEWFGASAWRASGARLTLRAGITDHDLHDLGAPLVGACRLAADTGATGELVFCLYATPPMHAFQLVLRPGAELVLMMPKKACALEKHLAFREIEKPFMEATEAPPPKPKPTTKPKSRAARRPPPEGPIETLRDVELVDAMRARLLGGPKEAYAELEPLLLGPPRGANEDVLRAFCHVIGHDLVAYQKSGTVKRLLQTEPQLAELLEEILLDPRCHDHYREGALRALAERGPSAMPLVVAHCRVADALSLAGAVRALGKGALDKIRPHVAAAVMEEIEIYLRL